MSLPKTLTPEQCESLLDELKVGQGTDKQKSRGLRNSSIAMVMLETGIRVGELCGLHVDDLFFLESPVEFLIVRRAIAKNKKERQIPVSDKLCETIKCLNDTWWTAFGAKPDSFAFFTCEPSVCLTTRTIERIILSASKAALNMEVTPHILRHTFASRMMKKANSRIVQALLGHSSLQSTQIYMHPDSVDLKRAIHSTVHE